MIQEDAVNFQKQLVHLFRVFEVNVAVGLHNKGDEYGCTLLSNDPQLQAGGVDATPLPKKQRAKRPKDVLSG
jgi:hypothetical protein